MIRYTSMHRHRIEVLAACPPPGEQFGGSASTGRTCASFLERSAIVADMTVAMSPGWLTWAVSEALAGRAPRTRAYLLPSRSGGVALDLGRGPVAEHEALAPRRRVVVEDAGDVLFDDFESMGWPAIRAPGGAA